MCNKNKIYLMFWFIVVASFFYFRILHTFSIHINVTANRLKAIYVRFVHLKNVYTIHVALFMQNMYYMRNRQYISIHVHTAPNLTPCILEKVLKIIYSIFVTSFASHSHSRYNPFFPGINIPAKLVFPGALIFCLKA